MSMFSKFVRKPSSFDWSKKSPYEDLAVCGIRHFLPLSRAFVVRLLAIGSIGLGIFGSQSFEAAASLEETQKIALLGEYGPSVGGYAPAFQLKALNEMRTRTLVNDINVGLDRFVGIRPELPKKLVILAFLDSSDHRIVSDMELLQEFFKRYHDEGLIILAVDTNSNPDSTDENIHFDSVTFPILGDPFHIVSRRYGVNKIPTIFMIDRKGLVISAGEEFGSSIEKELDVDIRRHLANQSKTGL